MNNDNSTKPYNVTEHCWIKMPDGVHLAARIWLPEGALSNPVPAVLEYIPYRKVDMVRARDERNHPFLAEHGLAAIRVDMRGSGDSEGQMSDMYSQHELEDARHIIEWLAEQPWCNGKVGMFGTSWGGTASLQANIHAPDALKAVVAVCATHDRYEDDIHHMGGCLLTDSVEWGTTLPTILGAPQSTNVGKDWYTRWKDRLEKITFPLEEWLLNEDRGSYWRHGSVIHQADQLSAPMLCVGGWADRYSNSVMSLVDRRPDLTWGIIGPWGHHYPDQGHPGPAISFQKIMLEWWRHWLLTDTPAKPVWPRLRTWIRNFDPPADAIDIRSGEWIQSTAARDCTRPTQRYLTGEGLSGAHSEICLEVPPNLRVGTAGADTGYFGRFGGLPPDQHEDDEGSLCFDTETLSQDCVIYGAVELELDLCAKDTQGQLCLRLNDVAPDGTSVRITWAIRNLALDDILDAPDNPLPIGSRTVRVRFPTAAYRIQAGHKLRLAISQSYWPMIWPPQKFSKISLLGGSLTLPEPIGELDPLEIRFPDKEDLPKVKAYSVIDDARIIRYQKMLETGEIQSGWHQPFMSLHYDEINTKFGFETCAEFRVCDEYPLSAECTYEHSMTFERPDGTAVVACKVHLSSDDKYYKVSGEFCASWNGGTVKRHDWKINLARIYA